VGNCYAEVPNKLKPQKHDYGREAHDDAAPIRIGRPMFIEGADISS
jgi:hypothetical protein